MPASNIPTPEQALAGMARIGNPRAEGEPGVGVLWPRQAELLAEPYALPSLGFA